MAWTAFVLGFVGSLHCAGMCSPLMMAVSNLSPSVIANKLLYNGGRIFTYGIVGAGFSSVGSLLPLARYQNIISIALGVILLSLAFSNANLFKIPFITVMVHRVTVFLRDKFAFFIKRSSRVSFIMLGMLNGFLPCGLSLVAFTYCITLAGPVDGFTFMLLFGAGTLPVMLGLSAVILLSVRKLNFDFKKVMTVLQFSAGVLLIARVFLHAGIQASQGNGEIIDIVLCR